MDRIFKTLICGGEISLAVLDTTDVVNEAIKIHALSPSAAKILGGLLVCGAYMASFLKTPLGSVSLTVKAKDGDGAVSVSADSNLHLRGYADGSCSRTLAGGTLTVVRNDGYSMPFVGTCEITSDDVSDIMAAYFQISEQIPTAVCVGVEIEDGVCRVAGGVIMQALPDASDGAIDEATDKFEKYAAGGTLEGGTEAALAIFGATGGDINEYEPVYKCNCSQRKIEGVLISMGYGELAKLIEEEGQVKVHCHYCNRDYTFDKDGVEELFRK